ncbi:MAG: GNAT family N-acetyltransferase [Firmicutes bacterium]|nr:GNAT family N-acetyltransferase [Bacillota bacterium]
MRGTDERALLQKRDFMRQEIRQAEEQDYPKIAALERLYMSVPWSLDTILAAAAYGTLFFVSEQVEGYGSIKLIEDIAEVNNICVQTDSRKLGIGQAILDCMVQTAFDKGVKKVLLEVAENNRPAIAMYAKNGFLPLYTRPNYYHSVGAIVMQKVLVGI